MVNVSASALSCGCASGAHTVLDTVAPPPQRVVLQVEDLEAGVHVLDEATDVERALVITQGHRVDSEAGLALHVSAGHGRAARDSKAARDRKAAHQLIDDGDQRVQVLLDGQVEGVAVLEIDGHAEDLTRQLERQEAARLRGAVGQGQAAQPAAEEDLRALPASAEASSS